MIKEVKSKMLDKSSSKMNGNWVVAAVRARLKKKDHLTLNNITLLLTPEKNACRKNTPWKHPQWGKY